MLKKKLAVAERELKKHQDKEDKAKAETWDLEITRRKVHLTTRGSIALGVRKSLALTSAVGFPLSALLDVSRWTVVRAEISVWATWVARTRAFHNFFRQRLRSICVWRMRTETENHQLVSCTPAHAQHAHPDVFSEADALMADFKVPRCFDGAQMCVADSHNANKHFILGGTEFTGDATNSGIYQNSKLSGLLVTSMYLVDPAQLSSVGGYRNAFAVLQTLHLVLD